MLFPSQGTITALWTMVCSVLHGWLLGVCTSGVHPEMSMGVSLISLDRFEMKDLDKKCFLMALTDCKAPDSTGKGRADSGVLSPRSNHFHPLPSPS